MTPADFKANGVWKIFVRSVRSQKFPQTKLFVEEIWHRRSLKEKLVWSFQWSLLPIFVLADLVDDRVRSLM